MNRRILPPVLITKADIADPADPNRVISSETEMHQIAETAARVALVDLEDLPPTTQLLGTTGKARERRVRYELYADTGGWSQNGVIGKMKPAQFFDAVASFIHAAKLRISASQPNGDWQVCAYRLYDKPFLTQSPATTGISKLAAHQLSAEQAQGPGVNAQMTRPEKISVYKTMLEIALYDTTQAKPIDYWAQTTGRGPGRIARYVESGYLIHMPPFLKVYREQAEAVLVAFDEYSKPKLLSKQDADAARELLDAGTLSKEQVARVYEATVASLEASLEHYRPTK